MRNIVLTLIMTLCCAMYSQDILLCGTETPANAMEMERAMRLERELGQTRNNNNDTITFAIQIHIVRGNNGVENFPNYVTHIENGIIDSLNHYFAPAKIKFYQCDGFDYINDDAFRNHNKLNNGILISTYNTPNKINLYYVDSVFNANGTQISGYAHFPGDPNLIVIEKKSWNKSTVHEMGHYFYLFHTHEKNINGAEYVNGTNCETAGDLCCDTPADPGLIQNNGNYNYYIVNTNCQYTGNLIDTNGDFYSPDTSNIMSYSRQQCRTNFTSEQYLRMREWAEDDLRQQFVYNKFISNTAITSVTTITNDVITVKSVNVISGELRLNYCKEVVIESDFEMQPGTMLTIEK